MTNDIDRHLGKRLRQRSRTLGLTQQQIAEAVGVRFQQIQKYECGANRVSAARLYRIAGALEVPVTYFFEGLSEPHVGPLGNAGRSDAVDLSRTYRQLGEPLRKATLGLPAPAAADSDAA